ncbi:MAG: hypothetical protein ABJ301_08530, partial [Rhodopirellula bahusiensis]
MRHTILFFGLALLACSSQFAVSSAVGNDVNSDWPQWRGPDASGSALESNPPTTWSESENILWKIDVPGIGSSTPIILGDRVYV